MRKSTGLMGKEYTYAIRFLLHANILIILLKTVNNYFCHMHINDDLQARWWALEARLVERFGKKPDMEAILFLIGLQELGTIKDKFTKEQKQDLMHIAVCKLLLPSGYYVEEGIDDDGWPHYRQLKPMPDLNPIEQENFLKDHVLMYFEENDFE